MTPGVRTPVVIYAAKSTEDKHGSIPTQLEQCREFAERNGMRVVEEFQDEGFSAFKGNRGPGLEAAKELAVRIAAGDDGECALLAQDTDRFARGAGDAPGAADHLGEIFFRMKRSGVQLWSLRSGRLDALRAALEGERSTDESRRKRQAVTDGLQRRKQRGQPVGRMPFGYRVEHSVVDGLPVSRRVPDERMAAIVRRAYLMAEQGYSDGHIARTFNQEGLRTQHDRPFQRNTMKLLLTRDHYTGEKGYPAIIDRDQWQAVNDQRARRDRAKRERRKGGRPTASAYLLRQLAFCGRCGAVLGCHTRHGTRRYQCSAAMGAVGLCDAKKVPASILEASVLNHLGCFVGGVEEWLTGQLAERDAARVSETETVQRLRAEQASARTLFDRVMGDYRRLTAEGATTAYLALDEAERLDAEVKRLDALCDAADEAAVRANQTPDLDAALDLYNRLAAVVNDCVEDARGDVEATNRALRSLLAGLWVEHEVERERLLIRFELLIAGAERLWLPPASTQAAPIEPLGPQADGGPATPGRTQGVATPC